MTISNEVLAERIEGFTRQTVSESQQVRRDLTAAIEQMGRVQDAVTSVADRLTHHEQEDGHSVAMLVLSNLSKDTDKLKVETERIRELTSLKTEVIQMRADIEKVKAAQDSAKSFREGQHSALSTAEKFILLIVAASGPLLTLVNKL
jgi:hypothetical protein